MSRRAWAIAALSAGFVVGYVAAASADDAVRLFTDKDDDVDSAVVIKKIKAEIALGEQGKGRLLVLAAVTTDEWGCECPPFVYAPFSSSASDEATAYFYPVVKAGPSPGSFQVGSGAGTYELTGRFTRDKLDLDGWLKAKHRARAGSLGAKQPVFAVERWCFRKAAEPNPAYADILVKMQKAGVVQCK